MFFFASVVNLHARISASTSVWYPWDYVAFLNLHQLIALPPDCRLRQLIALPPEQRASERDEQNSEQRCDILFNIQVSFLY